MALLRSIHQGVKPICTIQRYLPAVLRRRWSDLDEHVPTRISDVHMKNSGLMIQWSGHRLESLLTANMPYVYLRDQQGQRPANQIDISVQAKHVEICENGQKLLVTWSDGCSSYYQSTWLLQHRTGTDDVSGRLAVDRVFWSSTSFASRMLHCDYEDVMSKDSTLLDCILNLESCGAVLIENAGLKPRQAVTLCDRIAYPKPVVYGYDVMKLEAKPNATSLAYTNIQIPLHTDMPYCEHVPGILLLHCIHQVEGDGGRTMCSDGFHVVEELKKRKPAAFQMLSQYPIQFRDAGDDYVGHNIDAMQKPIRLDSMGEVVAIRHNNGVRGSRFPCQLMGQLYDWYSAYYEFSNLMYDREFLVEFKLQPGQILVLDNTRILHGRSGFDLGEGVYRYLEEVYLDWDEARSKARVIMGQKT